VHFAVLAVAMPKTWHSDVIRLAKTHGPGREIIEGPPGNARERELRRKGRGLTTALVDLLDGLDADPDLEPTLALSSIRREAEADECEIPEDDEPSLGSLDRRIDQTAWCAGGRWSPEAELDTSDDEPSFGGCDHHHSQELWAMDDRRDLEQDGGESGIGDRDGLLEQVGSQDWQHGGWCDVDQNCSTGLRQRHSGRCEGDRGLGRAACSFAGIARR
jgi:hypothetical protein